MKEVKFKYFVNGVETELESIDWVNTSVFTRVENDIYVEYHIEYTDLCNHRATESDYKGCETVVDTTIGVKFNKDKAPLSILFKQFPKALEAISKCSEYGHDKYKETDIDFLNFKRVLGGSRAYADAGLRHRLQSGLDSESGLPHQFHMAWNSLAELQLWIEENE